MRDKRNPFRPNDRRVRRIRNPYRIVHRCRPGAHGHQNLIARMDEIERTQRALAKRFKRIERLLGTAIAKSFRSRRAR